MCSKKCSQVGDARYLMREVRYRIRKQYVRFLCLFAPGVAICSQLFVFSLLGSVIYFSHIAHGRRPIHQMQRLPPKKVPRKAP